ncbi:MAG: phytoene desaturase family protein [Patescibacteria group bacterium]
MPKHVIIVGSGLGGLATAAFLAKAGLRVSVYEKNEQLGGRASLLEKDGFRFDMGPSWYLMPDIFQRTFDLLGENIEDYLNLVKLDPSYRVYFKDEARGPVDLRSELAADKVVYESLEAGSAAKLDEYLRRSKYQYEVSKKDFLYGNIDSPLDFFTPRLMIEGSRLSVFQTMDKYVKRWFSSPFVQKLLQYPLVFLGNSPFNAPAIYSMMTHIDTELGVFYPKGGIYEITKALVAIGAKHGVSYHTQANVEKIMVKSTVATGIRLSTGEEIQADVVVSNADLEWTDRVLLGQEQRVHSDAYWKKRVLAPSAFIAYLGIKGRVNGLEHHTLVFAKDWKENFRQIFDRPQWPSDPSFYVCAPSKTDDSVAPPDHENLFILVPVAAGLDDSAQLREDYLKKILATIEEQTGERDLALVSSPKSFSAFKILKSAITAIAVRHSVSRIPCFRRPGSVQRQSTQRSTISFLWGRVHSRALACRWC